MNARAVAAQIEKFARMYYRAGGKLDMSPCEKTRVLGDLAHTRCVQARNPTGKRKTS